MVSFMDTKTAAIANKANEARRTQGVAIRPLSEASGVTLSTLTRMLSGESDFRVSTLLRVANALDADAGAWINEATPQREESAGVAA